MKCCMCAGKLYREHVMNAGLGPPDGAMPIKDILDGESVRTGEAHEYGGGWRAPRKFRERWWWVRCTSHFVECG
jgi:hypothetical protein